MIRQREKIDDTSTGNEFATLCFRQMLYICVFFCRVHLNFLYLWFVEKMSVRGNHLGTEYRRSYKKSQYNCCATTYQQNLDFRREQKRRFVEHNPDPFDWDPEDIESDSGSDLTCRNQNGSSNRTHTQYKHEKLNQLYEKRLTDRQDSSHSGAGMKKVHSNSQSKDFQPSNRSHQVVGQKEEMAYDDSGSESETSVVHVIEPEFVKKSSTKLCKY